MLISIVIPCYNCEKYIKETIESVLNQTHKDVQIICVDNNSTDKTIEIIQSLIVKNKNIELYSERRAGANYARNLGLEKSKGKYIQFLDSDDVITKDKLEKQSSYLDQNNLDIVISDRKKFNSSLKLELGKYLYSDLLEKPIESSIYSNITSGNPLYRTEFVKNIGGYLGNLKTSQDWEFHIRLFFNNPKAGYLKGFFFYVRAVEDSLSSNYVKVSNTSCWVINKFKKEFKEEKVYLNEKVRDKILFTFFISYIHAKDEELAYKKEFLYWYKLSNGINSFSGINKLLIKLMGIKNYLSLKRKVIIRS